MPISNVPPTLMPLSDVVGSDPALVVRSSTEKDACSVQEMIFIGQTPSDDLVDKDAPVSSLAPSWEKIATLLK